LDINALFVFTKSHGVRHFQLQNNNSKILFRFFQSWFSHEVDKTLPGGPSYGAHPYGCKNRRRLMTSN